MDNRAKVALHFVCRPKVYLGPSLRDPRPPDENGGGFCF